MSALLGGRPLARFIGRGCAWVDQDQQHAAAAHQNAATIELALKAKRKAKDISVDSRLVNLAGTWPANIRQRLRVQSTPRNAPDSPT